MKLSELKTEELAELLCVLTPPVCRMARDPEVLAAFDKVSFGGMDAMPPLAGAALVWEALIPLLMRRHRDDVYAVLAALTGKTAEGIARQRGLETLKDLQSVWDGELAAFFTCAGTAEQEKF